MIIKLKARKTTRILVNSSNELSVSSLNKQIHLEQSVVALDQITSKV